ncbi:hypothetical protein LTS18_006597, partial [Coniosporium uncinatum]
MSTLLDLLQQKTPQFQTHQALLVLGLQNDFISPNGKLPVPAASGFVERVKALVPSFRDHAGDIIWVRSVFEAERGVLDDGDGTESVILDGDEPDKSSTSSGDEIARAVIESTPDRGPRSTKRAFDLLKRMSSRRQLAVPESVVPAPPIPSEEDELFFSRTSKRAPCCLNNTSGVEFANSIREVINPATDTLITKSHYSAFNSTSLLLTLRMKFVTELYICGCLTNLSVYATALDAARHGMTINLVEDCLGYRKVTRHQEAMRQMVQFMGAYITNSVDIMSKLEAGVAEHEAKKEAEEEEDPHHLNTEEPDETLETRSLQELVQKMRIRSNTPSIRSLRDRGQEDTDSIRSRRSVRESYASSNRASILSAEVPTVPRRTERSREMLQERTASVPEDEPLDENQPWLKTPTPPAQSESQKQYIKAPIRMRQRSRRKTSDGGERSSSRPSRPRAALHTELSQGSNEGGSELESPILDESSDLKSHAQSSTKSYSPLFTEPAEDVPTLPPKSASDPVVGCPSPSASTNTKPEMAAAAGDVEPVDDAKAHSGTQ